MKLLSAMCSSCEPLDELRIARDLEGLDPVRLEAIGLPNLEYRRIRNAELGGQFARAPVGGPLRRGLGGHTSASIGMPCSV